MDAQLDALGHVDRRRLLIALLHAASEGDGTVELDQMASDTAERRLDVSMHHSHLPTLEAEGFVDTTEDDRAVTTGPRFEDIVPLLELLDANRDQLPDDWV